MRWQAISVGLSLLFSSASSALADAKQDNYVIVSFVSSGDPYFAAAEELRKIRGGRIIQADLDDLPALVERLRQAGPKYVAIVLQPVSLDENLARRLMKLATEIDDDPFQDFAYGFVTGASPADAVALAGAGKRSESKPRRPDLAMIGVAGAALNESMSTTQVLPLRQGGLKQTAHMIAAMDEGNAAVSGEVDPQEDDAFIREAMPQLEDHSILLFAGHGYPRRVVGGPTYRHLAGRRFDGAVVLNIACYTGVTSRWFDNDWQAMQVREKTVPAEESFCLNMLKTGAAAYVAYVSARPAGPAMFGDALTLATAGKSIGELMRENANSVVLAHLQQGYDALDTAELADGAPIDRQRKVQDVLHAMSTGGVLFGDPAYVPFKRQPKAHPVHLTGKRRPDALVARLDVAGPLHHLFCSDQLVMWDDQTPSIRLEAVVPLGDRYFKDVRLTDSSLGEAAHRLTAAMEEHEGQRFLHLKASFAQPEMQRMMQLAQAGLSGTFEIQTSNERPDAPIVRRREAR